MTMIRQEQDVAVQDNVRAVRGETAGCPDRIILIILTEKGAYNDYIVFLDIFLDIVQIELS